MHELCGGQRTLWSARDHVADLAGVGEGSVEGYEKETEPVVLAGGLMMKQREYSFPGEGS